MNDEKEKLELEPLKSPIERLGENLEVLSKKFEKVKQTQKTDAERIQKVNTTLDLFRYDLGNPRREHGYTPTREIALAAHRQSQGFISTENLEGHKVIKDLDEQLNKYVGQANMKFNQLRREISNIPSPDNMHDLLNENFKFNELNNKVKGIERDQESIVRHGKEYQEQINAFKETYNGNDHPTGPEFDELKSDYAELIHKFNCIINYIVGYTTGKDSTTSAHILKAYEHNPKKESKDNEDPTGTSKQSQ